MATTFVEYTGDGNATKQFSFPSYKESDIKVRVDEVLKTTSTHYNITSYTTTGGGNVVFTSGNIPTSPAKIHIYRDTEVDTAKATYQAGSSVKAGDLNNNNTQLLYKAQEEQLPQQIHSYDIDDDAVIVTKIKDGAVTTAKIAADNITSALIADDQINSEHYAAVSIDTEHIANENVTTAKLAPDAVTSAKLADNAVNSEHYVDGSIDREHLAADIVNGTKIADDSIDSEHYVDLSIDTQHVGNLQITTGKIADGAITDAKIAGGSLDNRYYTETELDAGQLDNRYYTETESDARYFNISTGDTIKDGDTFPDNDTTIATTAAINDRIIDLVDDVGGFVPIANETSFPNANPDVNNGTGTLVSIKALSQNLTSSGSGVISISNGTVGNSTVTITGAANSTTYAATFGMIVETTTTLNTYTFHRLVPKATEVTTVAGISSNVTTVAGIASNVTTVAGISSNVTSVAGNSTNINAVAGNATNINAVAADASDIGVVAADGTDIGLVAGSIGNVNTTAGSIASVNTAASNINSIANFGDQYQVASSAPSTDGGGNALAAGDLYFDTSSNELRVHNGSTFQGGVTATGNLAGLGANTFTGNQSHGDNVKSIFGTGNDLEIYHSGSHSIINDTGTGNLHLQLNGTSKLNINSTGAHIAGNLTVNGNVDGRDVAADGTKLDGISSSAIANVVQDTTPQLGGDLDVQNRTILTNTTNNSVNLKANGSGVVVIKAPSTSYDATLQLNCSQNSHGIKLKSPPHSAAASYTLTFPNSIVNNGALKTDSSGNLSFGLIETSNINNDAITTQQIADNTIVNADINASAAIAGSKISPTFTSNLTATGNEHKFTAGTSGDLALILEADTDNNAENDLPKLLFRADGGIDEGAIFLGNNTLNIANSAAAGGGINLRTSGNNNDYDTAAVRMNITPSGQITMYGNVDCNAGLDVSGNITVTGTVDGVDLQTLNTAVSANTAKTSNATHTGDVTGSTSLTLAASGVSAGSYGSATAIPVITVDAKGRITAASTNTVNTTTNLTQGRSNGTYSINSSTGSGTTILGATTSLAGILTAADKSKLDGIASSANNYSHPNHSGEVTSSGDGAMTIADNVVDEANLKISNSPQNGYMLTAQSGNTGGLTWAPAAAGATGASNDEIFWENGTNVTADYTITNGKNAGSFGPITIDSGVTVTIGSGETWTVV